MIDANGKFYLGRTFNTETRKTTDEALFYDPDDLTTHAVVVGMTGSGKTGLCIDLLEEAALNDVPALMVDPKGDITNTLLHFPDLLPEDFAPWVNADEARRENKSIEEASSATADLWRNGLASWDIEPERIQALKESARFAIYTPGSDAGYPLSILASLAAPKISWETNKELLREQISGTVTALLGLLGMKDVDPVRTREHILLANIFESAWSQGKDLNLGELIMQVQSPPFEKLGFFEVNTFFPEKDRFELAMMLNNILASPAFQAWIEGEPLDVEKLLYSADGRIRHTIFYIAHLSEAERMFFVTLLYSAVETWMRAQSGTTSLRALIYFDEIFGYLPPVGNPPSKEPILRMLKQARAFGVGQVLATQNPVDVDYKALSNAGTWFIGKLGTEQDKERLLDGLSSAAGGALDKREYADMISSLGKRVFLLRNVHEKHPVLFQTRWAMNYLAGPVTRLQIPDLNALGGAPETAVTPSTATGFASAPTVAAAAPAPAATPEPELAMPGSTTRPAVSGGMGEFFLPNNLTLSAAVKRDGRSLPVGAQSAGILYRPLLLAQADVRFTNRKYNLDVDLPVTALVEEPDRRGAVRWEEVRSETAVDARNLDRRPLADARFVLLEAPLSDSKVMRSIQADFVDWIYRDITVKVRANETLKVYAGPDVDADTFKKQCLEAAEDLQEVEVDKLEASYARKIAGLQKKLDREERELREDEAEHSRRKQQELTSYAETVFSLFSRRKRSLSSSLSKRSMTARAKEDIDESVEEIAKLKAEVAELEEELETALDEIEEKWTAVAEDVSEIAVSPYKKDIDVQMFGVGWQPYHLVLDQERFVELSGFGH